jgi:hypothetical protein
MAKIIEAEHSVFSMWEPDEIEGWPLDDEGNLREIETAARWWIKWNILCVIWDMGQMAVEYAPTSDAGVADDCYKRPSQIYVGAVEREEANNG